MAEVDVGVGKVGVSARRACKDRLKVSRKIYKEARREFRFHDIASVGLDKKAQSLMTATALVATLFAILVVDGAENWWSQKPVWQASTFIFLVGMIVTFVLCIFINHIKPRPTPSVGDGLLCHGKLDDKVYEVRVAGGKEDYYKLYIKEYSLAITEQKRINKKKGKMLDTAYIVFAIFLVSVIPGLVIGLV